MTVRTLVIGGGIAGLATAALLAAEGHDVTVLERRAAVGGRAGSRETDGFRFDTGPSWYLMPRVYEHFFRMLGTTASAELELTDLDPAYRVFREPESSDLPAETFDVPRGRERVAAAFESRERGAAAALADYLDSAEHATRLAERRFLYNPFTALRSLLTKDVLRGLPRLAGLLGGSLESFAAKRFRDPLLRQVLGYPAVFLGTTPADAPALFHLMSALDLGDGVSYPQGGFAGVVARIEELARDRGVSVITDAEATRIVTGRARHPFGRRQVRGVEWRDAEGRVHRTAADVVVSAADLHHTETSLLAPRDRDRTARWWRRRDPGPGAAIAMLGVRGALPQLPHHSLFFTRDWHENFGAIFGRRTRIPDPASLYVCRPSATDDQVAPPGHENLFVLIPIPADPSLGSGGSDGDGDLLIERAVDASIDAVAAWADIPDLRERIVVRETLGPADFARDLHAWRGGMLGPGHTLRQSAMFRPQNASKRVGGLYFAGGTVAPGIGVPMCLISAELVLKRVRGDRSAGPLPEPAVRERAAKRGPA